MNDDDWWRILLNLLLVNLLWYMLSFLTYFKFIFFGIHSMFYSTSGKKNNMVRVFVIVIIYIFCVYVDQAICESSQQ